jgi:hypothetical protein
MEAYKRVEVYRHSYLTSALDGGEWSASRLGRAGLVGLEDRVSVSRQKQKLVPSFPPSQHPWGESSPTSSDSGGSSLTAAGLNSHRNIVKNQNKYTINVFFRTRKETCTEILFKLFSKLLGWLQPFSIYGRVDLVIWTWKVLSLATARPSNVANNSAHLMWKSTVRVARGLHFV